MPRGIDAKMHGLLRNILISPLEGEKKFLSELCELRNFREGFNLKNICRHSNSDRRLYFLRNINYNSDMLHHYKNNKGRLGILAQHEAGFEPSPAFVMLTEVRKRLLPLTKREGLDSVINSDFKSKISTNNENNFPRKELSALVPQYLSNFFDTHHSQLTTHYSPKRKVAFTLAEVLITLGIIGIVASMTIPVFVENYQEKVRVTALKKAYSTISNAYSLILDEEGDPSQWQVETWDDVAEKFAKHINKAKVCGYDKGGCFASTARKDLVNNTVNEIASSASLVVSDGTVIGFHSQNDLKNSMLCENLAYCFNIVVDINGDKRPNQWGVDTFTFHVGREKILPRGAYNTHGSSTMCNPTATASPGGWYNGSGCGAWVIYKENMDYLKCVRGIKKYCEQKYYF